MRGDGLVGQAADTASSIERGLTDRPSKRGPRRKKALVKKEAGGQMPVPSVLGKLGGMGVGKGAF